MSKFGLLIAIFMYMIIFTGVIILQIFLSKRESKWPGLILPIISFVFSIIAVLSSAVLLNQSTGEIIGQVIIGFLLTNIPTFILIAIYFACREKFKKKKEIDKMNIQDLE